MPTSIDSINSMKKYCLALDLKNDPQLVKEYEEYHQNVWPEILASITESGIDSMEIYRVENRLFMIMLLRIHSHLRVKVKWTAGIRRYRSGSS